MYNNGTADTNEVTIRNDAAIGAFPEPVYTSHRFAGWYQGDNQTTYTDTTTCNDLPITDDAIVLTAHWVEQVTVTFKSGTSTIESRTFDKGSAVGELPAIGAQAGYTYTWKISNEETEINSESTFDESKVVSLIWMKKNTVQFKDGIDSSVIVTREIIGSQKIGDFPSTDKGEHYKFIGWYQGNALTSFTKDTSTSDMPTTDDTIVLTARWVESVTITFKNGTETVGTVTKWWDEALSNVPEASKEGHRFDGWYIAKDEQQVRIENGMQMSVIPTTTIDAEARWIQQVTVTFMDGETSKGTRTIDVSEQIGVLPEVPSRAGYEYKGWYMEDGITKLQPSTLGTTLVGNSTTVYTATIHTEWIKITKIVLYNGDLLYRTIDIDEGGTVGDLPILADTEERTFNGWYKQDGTSLSPDTAATSLPETTNLYAKWTVKITFEDAGRDDVSVVITQGTSIENLPVPDAKVGYEFKGWYKSDNTTKIESTSTFDANTTVHSEWTKKNTVRFVYNNGTDQVDEREIEGADTIGAFPVPTYTDHRLTGWYQGDVLTTYTGTTTCNDLPITDDEIILTAHWVEQVTVTFMNGTTEISKKTIDINTSITALPTIAASSGYSYKWMLSDNTTEVTSETKFNSDTTVSAKWTKTTIVVFHDGNTVLEERRLAENETVGAFPVPNNKDGYTFNGWYKQDGTTILPTTKATDLPHTTDLYAKWTQNESPSPYTPGHNPPSLERIETSSETIPNDDGSVTEKTSKTTTRVDGSKTEVVTESTVVDGTTITKVTETETDSRGNTTVSEQTTRTTENEDGSITKEIGIKDDEGNEKNIEITGDDETVTAVIPDMEPDSMKAVQKALSDMESKNVLIEIVTEEGQVTIPEESVPAIADNGYSVTVSNDDIGITLNNSVINNLDRIGGNVRLNFNEVEKDTLTEDQKDIIGDSYAITITLTVGDENVSLLGGQAEITVNPGYPIGKIYYVSSTGDVEDIEFEYDDATGEAKFIVEHFSVYVAVPADSGQDQSYYMYILIGALLVALALIAVAFMLRHR